jgi:putative phosphoesterase
LHARAHTGAAPVRLGIVSDIHCNIAGLRAALAVMGPIDELLCLGDCIDRNRFSNDVVALLNDLGAHIILGNHDEAFLAEPGRTDRDGVNRDLAAFLADQPLRRELTFGRKTVLMVHSTPWEPRGEYIFPHNERLALFAETGADYVLYGHTHAHVVARFGEVLVVNPGTAGEGRDSSDGRHLSCAVLDTVADEARMIHYMDPRFPASLG